MPKDKDKPTILGFKPSDEDWSKASELVDFFQKQTTLGTIHVSGILRTALDEMYKKYIDPEKRKR
ncbi:TPA: hypothetical protein VJS59_001637 [Streptococcus pyogenes]|uniref:hypothetical protein n=1 Tax=unclassified Peribacillus TaxID=2675266 RepID=UPI002B3EE8BF|nr:hypothetical protein [Streptococcus pyogenes]HER2174417.1 hypothetical protein [Streptococcus pyogenes]